MDPPHLPLNPESSHESNHPEKSTGIEEETSAMNSLARDFDPNRQSWKLLADQSQRLLLTVVVLAMFVMTLVLWERGNVSHTSKGWFNVVTTVLNLALGLNFLEVFKDMAKILRWRLLSSHPFSIQEADLILGAESLMKITKLMWVARRRPITLLLCAVWIFLSLLAQASIGLLSLNYSMDSGFNSTGVYTQPGTVLAPRLDCVYVNGACAGAPGAEMSYANSFATQVQDQLECPYNDTSDIIAANQSCGVFYKEDMSEYAYRFDEYNPDDITFAFPQRTNRTVRVTPSSCYQYDIEWSRSPLVNSTDGYYDEQVFQFHNSTFTNRLPIPRSAGALNSTTYIYNGTLPPREEKQLACGPRCMRMYAFRLTYTPGTPTNIFQCDVTVSEVFNATEPSHQIDDGTAQVIASAIGLTGRYVTLPNNDTLWNQYRLYTWGNFFEARFKTLDGIGQNMALGAVGVLAGMGYNNPKHLIPGTVPILGYNLNVTWKFVIALLVCIGVIHVILVLLMVFLSRSIIVIDDSYLTIGRLLERLMRALSEQGSLLNTTELATAIGERQPDTPEVVYGVISDDSGGKTLSLQGSDPADGGWTRRSFPAGRYS